MATTISPRDIERTNRWLTRSRRFGYVPPEPFALLALRLAARNRVRWQCSPLVIATLALLIGGWRATSAQLGRPGWSPAEARWILAADSVAALYLVLMVELGRRTDARIARLLPHRVSRGTAVSVWTTLGRARSAYAATAFVSEAGLVTVLLVTDPNRLALTALASLLGAALFVAVGLRRAITRATLATDPISLAIDEMLRSEEAFSTVSPLYLLAFALVIAADRSPVAGAWALVNLALVAGWLLVLNARPWPTMPGSPPDPLAGPYAGPSPMGAVQ